MLPTLQNLTRKTFSVLKESLDKEEIIENGLLYYNYFLFNGKGDKIIIGTESIKPAEKIIQIDESIAIKQEEINKLVSEKAVLVDKVEAVEATKPVEIVPEEPESLLDQPIEPIEIIQ